jgi:glycosyltransferase involved in cell wall biosynthesis
MIAVAQLGARMHYAVPRIFHSAGLLDRFYTDLAIGRGFARTVKSLGGFRSRMIEKVCSRVVPEIPVADITQFRGFGFRYSSDIRNARSPSDLTRIYLAGGKEFCRLILKRGLGKISALYSFNSASLELLERGRELGVVGVLEQTIAPKSIERELLSEEIDRWPHWEHPAAEDRYANAYCEREHAEWALADKIICGSPFVAGALASLGVPPSRCLIIPYGVESVGSPASRTSEKGRRLRVLFCGTVGLRKGFPYLLQAARMLGAQGFEYQAIGNSSLTSVVESEVRKTFQWPGSVPRSQVRGYFDWADVFVLPSICEGSATVCYEALAAGVPVITTPNAGSVIRDAVDGYIIPIRDGRAIAERLGRFQSNPSLLLELSQNARRRSEEFTIEKYGKRLLAAIDPSAALHA